MNIVSAFVLALAVAHGADDDGAWEDNRLSAEEYIELADLTTDTMVCVRNGVRPGEDPGPRLAKRVVEAGHLPVLRRQAGTLLGEDVVAPSLSHVAGDAVAEARVLLVLLGALGGRAAADDVQRVDAAVAVGLATHYAALASEPGCTTPARAIELMNRVLPVASGAAP